MNTDFLKTKKDITDWLDEHEVEKYSLIEDSTYGYVVNVRGEVNLYNKLLSSIPVKFNKVSGSFSCSDNQLTSLEFCPITVGIDFYCSHNQLTSLEFCPNMVAYDFDCHDNQLNTLDFCPANVGGDFYCHGNPALGSTQEIKDFSEILSLHQEIVRIKKEKENIEKELGKVDGKHNTDTIAFKI